MGGEEGLQNGRRGSEAGLSSSKRSLAGMFSSSKLLLVPILALSKEKRPGASRARLTRNIDPATSELMNEELAQDTERASGYVGDQFRFTLRPHKREGFVMVT